MDKNILKQYASMLKEADDEERRIRDMEAAITSMLPLDREVADVVTRGKRGKKPLGTCIIRGENDHSAVNRKRAKLRERKAKKELHLSRIEMMVADAEEYIYSLEDSELRRILEYCCIDRKSWDEVAEAMGEGYTAEACKQKFSRFMRVK